MPKKTIKVNAKLEENFRIETRMRGHIAIVAQPVEGGGKDEGPNSLEYLFVSLSGCIATIGRIVAKQRRIDLRGLNVSVEADIDTDFLMGSTKEGRAGFTEIRVNVDIDADMSKAEKEAFLHEVDLRCPISDNIANISDVKFFVM